MKKTVVRYLCRAPIFTSCVCVPSTNNTKQLSNDGTTSVAKNRVSFSFPPDNLIRTAVKEHPQQQSREYSGSLIDAAASFIATNNNNNQQQMEYSTARSSVIVGTIFGHRRGRVSFCVQRDAAVPPPFLFEISIITESLAQEMSSGLLRIALECHRSSSNNNTNGTSSCDVWKAYCNGRDVGCAVRRRPTVRDRRILESMRTMTTGVGTLPTEEGEGQQGQEEDLVMYMRASYERVVGSKDAVSYHLINPSSTDSSPPQELSVFLRRTR